MENLSRSEVKRQHRQIEAAAKEIQKLNDKELERLGLAEDIIEEIKLCRNLKGGALKRQTKYVAKLLKHEPLTEIIHLLTKMRGSKLEANTYHHEAERLRDAIINEAMQAYQESLQLGGQLEMNWQSDTLELVISNYPHIDKKDLRSCAHQYVRSRNKVHQRELFRMIRAAAEKERIIKQQ